MVLTRTCTARKQNGDGCSSPPLRDAAVCFWHSPDHAEEAAEARRLGGLRRRRERTLAGAYEIDGLGSVPEIRRIVEIATMDALGLDNSVARGRLLIACALAEAKLLEVGELEDRLRAVEQTLSPRLERSKRR